MLYAVSFVSYFDNILSTKVVEATSWKEALNEAFSGDIDANFLSDNISIAKEQAFNCDVLFDVIEIKNNP